MKDFLIEYSIFINGLLFLLMGLDKWQAVRHKWRISEKTLLLLGLLGGGAGGWIGMHFFHHKTKKPRFTLVFVAGVFVMAAGFYFHYKL